MKRDFLKELNLADDVIEKIMGENGRDITKAKGDFDTEKLKAENLKAQLDEANRQIEAFKGMDFEGVKAAAADWEQKYNAAVADGEKKLEELRFGHALEAALTGSKAKNTKAVRALLDMDGLKLNGDEIVGLKDQLEKIKTENDYLFEGETPPPTFMGTTTGAAAPNKSNPFAFNFTGVRAKTERNE